METQRLLDKVDGTFAKAAPKVGSIGLSTLGVRSLHRIFRIKKRLCEPRTSFESNGVCMATEPFHMRLDRDATIVSLFRPSIRLCHTKTGG